jgi:CDP-diacylglycerol---glycerol-3-phosphate 3-phosphatidyltransferase
MLARWLRTWDGQILKPFLIAIARCGIGPDTVTIASFVVVVVSGFALSQGYLGLGACILLLGGLLDAIDGELARLLSRETQLGGFLDSISDHCGDFAVYLGLLWLVLNRDMETEVILIFVASFGSVFGSQVRSRARMAGIDTKDIGIFTRCERILVLVLGLFTGRVTAALWILAVLNNFSAAQRLVYVARAANPSHD